MGLRWGSMDSGGNLGGVNLWTFALLVADTGWLNGRS